MSLNPSQLEERLNNHFALLFNISDSVLLDFPGLQYSWLRCALTEKGRALLIETNAASTPFERLKNVPKRLYNGKIRMEETELLIDGTLKSFIAIYCRKKGLISLFSRLMADTIWHLINDGPKGGDPWTYIYTRLDGWRLLFSGTDSKAEEKGLIGELYVLKHLITKYDLPINIWTGPLGGVKDFRLENQNIEVKTTSVRNGYFVEINGLYQTVVQSEIERMIFIRLEETPNGPISLYSLKEELIPICESRGQAFELQKRFDAFENDIFNSPNRWEILESQIININSDFPKISEHSFINQKLPEGVIKISWTADLSALPKSQMNEFDFLN